MKARKIAENNERKKEELRIKKFATANPSVGGEETKKNFSVCGLRIARQVK
jgi:hypothetical protein